MSYEFREIYMRNVVALFVPTWVVIVALSIAIIILWNLAS